MIGVVPLELSMVAARDVERRALHRAPILGSCARRCELVSSVLSGSIFSGNVFGAIERWWQYGQRLTDEHLKRFRIEGLGHDEGRLDVLTGQ